jgi:hypothetical protein
MHYAVLAIGLFIVSSVISTVTWVASTPELALDFDHSTLTKSQNIASNDTAFIEQVKASLSDDISEPPTKQQWIIQNASMSTSVTRLPVKKQGHLENAILRSEVTKPQVRNRGLLVKVSHNGSYGVNETFIKNVCSEFAKGSP